ncbi:MAG: PocR ligand-binding domain-containing protein, partial [Desulfobaccales bacterium]
MESFDYRLADLLDMSILQTLSDSNFQATGLPMTIIDAYDASILVRSGWTDICLKFHRANPASNQRCLESDGFVKEHLAEGRSYQYKCLNGLWNIAMPIMVAGRHLGTLFLSQFYFEGEVPEREFFIRQAGQFGYDLDSYLEALDRLPVFSLEKVNYILAYDQALVRFISDLATQSLRVQKAHEELEGRVKERTAELAEASESVKENLRLRQQILDTIPSPIF